MGQGPQRRRVEAARLWPVIRQSASFTCRQWPSTSTRAMPIGALAKALSRRLPSAIRRRSSALATASFFSALCARRASARGSSGRRCRGPRAGAAPGASGARRESGLVARPCLLGWCARGLAWGLMRGQKQAACRSGRTSASLAQPGELPLQGGEAVDEVEDHGDAVEVDAEIGAQAGDRDETREAGGVETFSAPVLSPARPGRTRRIARPGPGAGHTRAAAAPRRVRCSRVVRRGTRG